MPNVLLTDPEPRSAAIPITAVNTDGLEAATAALGDREAAWVRAGTFSGKAGTMLLIPAADGSVAAVLFGLGKPGAADADPLVAGRLSALPAGTYRLAGGFPDTALAALAVALGAYRYTRYRAADDTEVRLELPADTDSAELRRTVDAIALARDLINTPSNRLGPAELAAAIRDVAATHGAKVSEIVGDALIAANFPMIHTVGAAAVPERAPRLIDLSWGDPAAARVTLVGKGVVFDTGGLDLKPSDAMLIMKKDMGGSANALALAAMIMGAGLNLRLRLLVPAVENAVAGGAFRPGDVLESRKGLSVEIGNTDAEGRLILGDALALASEEQPELLIDFATLTGAARVALGPDLPAIFTNDDKLAADLARHGTAQGDPTWRLPLWAPYAAMLESKIADINNAGTGGFAGSITAALFLQRFVGDGIPWMHVDLYAWARSARASGPEGGDAQSIRALFALLKERYPR